MARQFDNADYVDVAARIAEFRAKHPDGSLQPADIARPYTVETIDGRAYIVYVAAAYRTPDDPRPGIGAAWEPFPGQTNFTRNSELQNAETSAWGRAIVAALAADTKRSVASAEEVRNRQAERDEPLGPMPPQLISADVVERMRQACAENGADVAAVVAAATNNRTSDPAQLLTTEIGAARYALRRLSAGAGASAPTTDTGSVGEHPGGEAEPVPAASSPAANGGE